jgi:DHA2 family methylenomycin A resistance protein-like MFS transporter
VIALAAAAALALVLLDVTALAVLLPTIRLDLGSSSSGAAWVLAAHLLALAALLPIAARLPRARPLAAAGAALMVVGAVVAATADTTAAVVAGRALQGAGAAGLIGSLAPGRLRRASALILLALPAAALALGPLVGGVFAELNWWRVWFWAGVPLAIAAAIPALLAGRTRRGPQPVQRQLALAAGLTAITIALIQAEDWSWGASAVLLLAGAALIAVAHLRAPQPLAGAAAFAAGCLVALLFLMPEYFELVRRLSGLRSGVVMLALTVPAAGAWLLARFLPPRVALPTGALSVAAGLALLITLEPRTSYAVTLGALLLAGGGLGLATGALRGQGDPAAVAGWAAAGAVLGLAIAAEAFQFGQADERSGGGSFEESLAAGIGWAAVALLFTLAAAALISWRLRPASSAARPAGASSPPPRRPA